jgi:hypothetical protein
MTTGDFHRTNINLLRTDVDWLVATYGYGWTEKVRDIVHDHVSHRQQIREQGWSVTEYPHPVLREDLKR